MAQFCCLESCGFENPHATSSMILRSVCKHRKSLSLKDWQYDVSNAMQSNSNSYNFEINMARTLSQNKYTFPSESTNIVDCRVSRVSLNTSGYTVSRNSFNTVDYTVSRTNYADKYFWKHVYLFMCKFMLFDVWLLSRLTSIGKYKVILGFILFSLLLLYNIPQNVKSPIMMSYNQSSMEVSTFRNILFSILSRLHLINNSIHPFIDNEAQNINKSSLLDISTAFSDIYAMFIESVSLSKELKVDTSEITSLANKELDKLNVLKEMDNLINLKLDNKIHFYKDETKYLLQNIKDNLWKSFNSLSDTVEERFNDVNQKVIVAKDSVHTILEKYETIEKLNNKIKNIEDKLKIMDSFVSQKSCCDKLWNSNFDGFLEAHLSFALKKIISEDTNHNSSNNFIIQWLNSTFIDKDHLSREINYLYEKFKLNTSYIDQVFEQKTKGIIESIVISYIEKLKSNFSFINYSESFGIYNKSNIFVNEIKKMIKDAIMLYDADKTGQVDYALETGGGSIVSTRCSETYDEGNAKFYILGYPLWHVYKSPRIAIQPSMNPGECWPFKGSQGYLVIQLSAVIYPTGFSLEHIPVSISPTGSIDSAPKEFSVWGLLSDKDLEGKLLGKYIYDIKSEPLQYFAVQELNNEAFSFMELKIHSNNGNPVYTCLYRFRVHGTPV